MSKSVLRRAGSGVSLMIAGLLLLLAALSGQRARTADAATRPKLAVLIVVDQMRADYVDRFQADWTGGLKRLVTKGAWFTNAAYPYLETYTCAGHATVCDRRVSARTRHHPERVVRSRPRAYLSRAPTMIRPATGPV